MVAGFSQSTANETLVRFAALEHARGGRVVVDIGCGAARNLVPLAHQGWTAIGIDLSRPMADAALARIRAEAVADRALIVLAPMDRLPVGDASADLVVAHGIWNLARTGAEFRHGVLEAARVARDGAGLFVFTFSRRTVPAAATPVSGETFVFTEFSGEPQCFLSEAQLYAELAAAGFDPDQTVPLTEHNVPKPGALVRPRTPVIFEAAFRRRPRTTRT
jgi:SAM-dependent methyltransferase